MLVPTLQELTVYTNGSYDHVRSDGLVVTRWRDSTELGGRHFLETEAEDRGWPAMEMVTVEVVGEGLRLERTGKSFPASTLAWQSRVSSASTCRAGELVSLLSNITKVPYYYTGDSK